MNYYSTCEACGTHIVRNSPIRVHLCTNCKLKAHKREVNERNRPQVKMVGEDGNAFAILGRCFKAARRAGWTEEQRNKFQKEATSRDYNHLLKTVMEYFEVE